MKLLKLTSLLLFISLFNSLNSQAQSADSLLAYMDHLMSAAKDREATVEIILEGKSGKEKVREAILKQKGKDKKIYRYTQPEKQAGIATLSLPDGIMWLYMPAFGKATKISLLSKSQAFSGTDFSYEDMNHTTYAERYTPVLIDAKHSEYYLLDLLPKTNKSKYSHIELYLHKREYYPIKMEFYNEREKKFKVATYVYTKKDGYWYAEEVVMTDLNKEHSTTIRMSDMKFDQGIPDSVFTVEYLKQNTP